METYLVLIGLIILLLIPTLNYNFKILLILILSYLLFYPEKRQYLYDAIGIDKMNRKINDPNQINNQLNILFNEGNNILKELRQYKKNNKPVYLSIKISWKKLKNIADLIINNPSLTYPQHYYSILKEQRKLILNQMSSLIINSEAVNIKEISSQIDGTLPFDAHIRSIIRKMNIIIDNIFKIIIININEKWELNPSVEISPVDINSPEPYNQDSLDIII
jgi:hypothetical protein